MATMGNWAVWGVLLGFVGAAVIVWLKLRKLKQKEKYLNNEVKSKNVKERCKGFKQRIGSIKGNKREPDANNTKRKGKEELRGQRSVPTGAIASSIQDSNKPGKDNISKEGAKGTRKERGDTTRDQRGDTTREPGRDTRDTGVDLVIEV